MSDDDWDFMAGLCLLLFSLVLLGLSIALLVRVLS